MVRVRRKRPLSRFLTCVMLIGLSGAAVPAQDSNPAATVPAQPQSASAPSSVSAEVPAAPVTVLEDTLLRVMTSEPLNSKRVKDDQPVLFTVSEDVVIGDVLAIPRGATVHGVVVRSKKAGVLTGSPELTLKLLSLDLGGRSYPLDSYQFKVKGTSKTGPTEKRVFRGAVVGTAVGSLFGVSAKGPVRPEGSSKGVDMAAGAGLGAGVGTAISAATPGPGIWIPSESQVDFYLAAPVTVTPVSAKEAARLAQGLYPGGPTLYVRGDTP